jgi:uncharacterized membrane protein (DUF106 family)
MDRSTIRRLDGCSLLIHHASYLDVESYMEQERAKISSQHVCLVTVKFKPVIYIYKATDIVFMYVPLNCRQPNTQKVP